MKKIFILFLAFSCFAFSAHAQQTAAAAQPATSRTSSGSASSFVRMSKMATSQQTAPVQAPQMTAQQSPQAAAGYAQGQACYERLKTDPALRKDRGKWKECVAIFDSVAGSGSADAAKAAYSAGRLSREMYANGGKKEDQNQSLKYFNDVVNEYPSSSLADDALLSIARIRSSQGDKEKSKKALNALLERYPKGDAAPEAKKMLKSLEGGQGETESAAKDNAVTYEAVPSREDRSARTASANADIAYSPNSPTQLIDVRQSQKKDETLVTLEFTRQSEYRTVYDSSKPDLEVQLKDVYPREGLSDTMLSSAPLLSKIKIRPRPLGGTRVEMTLSSEVDYAVLREGRGVTISLRPVKNNPAAAAKGNERAKETAKPGAPSSITETSVPAAPASGPDTKRIETSPRPKISSIRPLRIVIDPGHGGEEKGAVGPHGIMEKDVVLAVSKLLAARLESERGAKVWLTRSSDETVSLEKRYKFAKKKKADLFISVHANASGDSKSSGIETYYLNNATDEAAKRLAAKENESWKGPRSEIDGILSTMLQNALTEDSRELAIDIQSSLTKNLKSRYKGVKNRDARSALFYVLVGSNAPSVLIETSFITNPIEERRLSDSTYQQDLASSIAQGIDKYLAKAPSMNAGI